MKKYEICYGRTYARITGKGEHRKNHARTVLLIYFPKAHQPHVYYRKHYGNFGRGDIPLEIFARWAEEEIPQTKK